MLLMEDTHFTQFTLFCPPVTPSAMLSFYHASSPRNMSSRPSSISNSSSDAGVKRRSFIVKRSCRRRPVRRATTTRRTPSISTTMTKIQGAKQATSPRDPALCWETTTWWSSSRSFLSRGSSPLEPHARQPSLQQEVRQSSQDFWSSWSPPSWKKSLLWQSEQLQGQQWPPHSPLVARRGHSPQTGHSVQGSCSASANQRGPWCVSMGPNQQHSLLTLSPTWLTQTRPWRSYPPMSLIRESWDNRAI